ncbi:MAG: hypothetical protein R3200_08650 [Xanthomonadales bacterium]|nr:hypothetical protein [Xanthomonadales bacterium]
MSKRPLWIALGAACLALGANVPAAEDDEPQRKPVETDKHLQKPFFKQDRTDDLGSEPCPDYFDTDWALTHDRTDPCWNEYLEATGQGEAEAAQRPGGKKAQTTSGAAATAESAARGSCTERDLSAQAVADNRYRAALQQRETGQKRAIDADFDPLQETAKSIQQLRDPDVDLRHLAATFAALDDDESQAIDKIEALDLRGLADEFEEVDLTGDQVLSHGEFHIYFGNRLADNNALCVDGQRILSLGDSP